MKITPKKPVVDYFEQMIKIGQPLNKKSSRSNNRAETKDREVNDSLLEIYQNEPHVESCSFWLNCK